MRHTRADISNPTTTGAPPHLAYRSDIDGLRGFAVVAVVAYHFYPTTVPGGFIGVDVFFVISGYLISSIILGALLDGSFNFTNFYVRRARRIFPALVVVLSFCFCLGWYTLLPDEFDRLNRNVAAGAGFVSNFQLWSEGGYFDTAANKKPLLHLWSLGIEEQFYLVWPLLLYITIRWHLRPLWTIVVIMVLSFALNLFVIRTHQNAAFYLPLTRFWELMIGGLIAWLEQRNRAPIHTFFPARLVPYLSGFGATLIFASSGFYHDKIEYPGLWALAPVAGTAAIIAAGPQCWINRNLLSGRLPVGVGLISYPLYLWHWPFLTFGRIFEPLWITKTGRIVLLGVSFAAAIATYRYIEQPIRRSTPTARLGLSLAGTLAVICVAALVAVGASVPPRNNDPGLEKIIQALRDWDYPTRAFQTMKFHGAKFYSQTSHRSEVTLFIGDSLMAQYAPRISQQVSAHPNRTTSVVFATEGGCWPIPYVLQNSNLNCQRTMNAAFELAKRNDVTRIVLAANWASFAKDSNLDAIFASLEPLLVQFSSLRRTTLILNGPVGPEFDPTTMFEGSRMTSVRPKDHVDAVPREKIRNVQEPVRNLLKSIAARSGVNVIDALDYLCSDGKCMVVMPDGRPIYKDGVHMRPFYVLERAGFMDRTIFLDELPRR